MLHMLLLRNVGLILLLLRNVDRIRFLKDFMMNLIAKGSFLLLLLLLLLLLVLKLMLLMSLLIQRMFLKKLPQ
jgi:hypothetical protein